MLEVTLILVKFWLEPLKSCHIHISKIEPLTLSHYCPTVTHISLSHVLLPFKNEISRMTLLFFALVTCAIFTSTSARFKFSSKALFSLITNFSRHIFNRD